jgi:putative transposase
MLRTVMFTCHLSPDLADRLNAESGRIYSQVMITHWRTLRHSDHWLSQAAAEQLNDYADREREPLLHAHSDDAASQGFYHACKITRAARKAGVEDIRYPYRRKCFRTTVWKTSGIKRVGQRLRLSLARGKEHLWLTVPRELQTLPDTAVKEVRLVYKRSSRRHEWHLVIDDGQQPGKVPGQRVMAGDMGEIHPITIVDDDQGVVMSCRELRAASQLTFKRLSSIQEAQANHKKGSKRWRKLQRRKNRFLAKQKRRQRDMLHKVSRAVVDHAVQRQVGTLALGDVRDIADGKRLNTQSQQKLSAWPHGKLRQFITYKAQAAGIQTDDTVDEAYTSQTCPQCGTCTKPKGRVYRCPACGLAAHRDVVGATNLLSRFTTGELSRVALPQTVKYRHPVRLASKHRGKRSSLDTGHMAQEGTDHCELPSVNAEQPPPEAAQL